MGIREKHLRSKEEKKALKKEIESDFGVQCDYKIADLSDFQKKLLS